MRRTPRRSLPLPPGPNNLEMLASIQVIQPNPLVYLQSAALKYGDIVHFPVGSLSVYFINFPDGIKHILQDNNHNYSKDTIQYNALSTVTGKGLLTSDGEFWLRQRRLAQPAFHRQRIQNFAEMMVASTQTMLDRWKPAAQSGTPLDIDREMMQFTLEIVGKALLGIDLSQDAHKLTDVVLIALDTIMKRTRSVVNPPFFVPTQSNRQFRRALAQLDEAVAEIIQQHRQADTSNQDLLSMLMHGKDNLGEESMTDRQLRDEVITILIAGHETVASALTWSWYLLSRNPSVNRQMQVELQRVLGHQSPTMEDITVLDLTSRVFDEALRLFPPAWLITRKAIGPDEVAGYPIPTGSLIVIGTSAIHHHPAYWQNLEGFDPDRFLPEQANNRPRYAYIPFGGGPRLCIGNQFALMEARIILSTVAQKYRLDLLPGYTLEIEPLVTLRPRHGLPMTIHPV